LLVVYIVWGSTFLAIRVAVRPGSGFPPFWMGTSRVLTGGALLLGWAALRGERLRPTGRELAVLAASGILIWFGGNGLVTWAETTADSGFAALVFGAVPLWVALLEAFIDRRPPPVRLVLSVVLGLLGLALLSRPVFSEGRHADPASLAALLLASVSWAGGTVLQRRRPVEVVPQVSAGYQQLFGGVAYAAAAILTREAAPHPSGEAMAAWSYLVLVGSVVAFTSYVAALQLLPTRIVVTHAYVNPVIALALGALVLAEPITGWTLAGTACILFGVAGVFRLSGGRGG
jgi:drug/metabolite transporter (DMT)-like permease